MPLLSRAMGLVRGVALLQAQVADMSRSDHSHPLSMAWFPRLSGALGIAATAPATVGSFTVSEEKCLLRPCVLYTIVFS